MNQHYFVTNYNSIFDNFGVNVDFKSLQSILLNRYFWGTKQNLKPENYTVSPPKEGKRNIFIETEYFKQVTSISESNRIQEITLTDKKASNQLQIAYNSFEEIQGIVFPKEIKLIASKEHTQFSCTLNFERIEFNSPIKFTATDSRKFKKQDIKQLLNK